MSVYLVVRIEEKFLAQKVGVLTGPDLLYLVEFWASRQQVGVGSGANLQQAEVGFGASW